MKKQTMKTACLTVIFLIMGAASVLAKPAVLGIVPFSVKPESNRAVMEPALTDLFMSRLAMKNVVEVADPAATAKAYSNAAKDPLTRLMETGKNLKADYILTGTLDCADTGLTLNAYMLDIATGKPVAEVSARTKPGDAKNDIIPLVNQATAQINTKVFSRGSLPKTEAPAPTVTPVDIHAHPDKLIKTIPEKK